MSHEKSEHSARGRRLARFGAATAPFASSEGRALASSLRTGRPIMIYNECSHGANIMTGAIRALISSTALLTGAVATSPAFAATLVDSNYGAVYLEAYSRASPIHDPVQFLTDEEDDDHDVDNDGIFILAPQPLSADVSVRSSGSHSSTSLAAEVTANWTTADHGTVTFNTLSSAFGDGTEFVPYDSHLSSQVWADNSLNSNLIGLNEMIYGCTTLRQC